MDENRRHGDLLSNQDKVILLADPTVVLMLQCYVRLSSVCLAVTYVLWLNGTSCSIDRLMTVVYVESISKQEARLSLGQPTVLPHNTFGGHVTSSVTCPYAISYRWSFGTVSEIFSVECNAIVDMNLIRPLNKSQGHSFWYQLISHIRLTIGCQ